MEGRTSEAAGWLDGSEGAALLGGGQELGVSQDGLSQPSIDIAVLHVRGVLWNREAAALHPAAPLYRNVRYRQPGMGMCGT